MRCNTVRNSLVGLVKVGDGWWQWQVAAWWLGSRLAVGAERSAGSAAHTNTGERHKRLARATGDRRQATGRSSSGSGWYWVLCSLVAVVAAVRPAAPRHLSVAVC